MVINKRKGIYCGAKNCKECKKELQVLVAVDATELKSRLQLVGCGLCNKIINSVEFIEGTVHLNGFTILIFCP